jgi:hypothetical protein
MAIVKSTRGLVISKPMALTYYPGGEVGPSGRIKTHTLGIFPSFDAQRLRSQLLFWDKLVHPISLVLDIGSDNAEENFLISAKVLTRQAPRPIANKGALAHIEGQLSVFFDLDKKEPATWSLARDPVIEDFLPAKYTEPMAGALLKLYDCIPVPDQDVPLEEILNFKEKRRSELVALRHHLDQLYQRIAGANETELSLKTETESLDAAITDELKVARESRLKWKLGSLEAKFNVTNGLVVGLAASQLGLSVTAALLSGLGAAAVPKVEFGLSAGLKDKKASGTPFEYVTSYHSELFRGT